MSKKPPMSRRVETEPLDKADSESEETTIKIREHVCRIVGTSPGLVVVRRLWRHRFRVNVLRAYSEQSGHPRPPSVARSYFIKTNDQCEIVKSDPPLDTPNQSLKKL